MSTNNSADPNDKEWDLLYKILRTLNNESGGGGSLITGAQNIGGSGVGVFKDKNGTLLEFKRLAAGAGISLTDGDFISIGGSGAASTLQVGNQAITNGAVTVAVVFPSAFAVAPVVLAVIGHVTGDDDVYADVLQDTITTTGFTAKLSSSVPNGNYKLNWMAA